MKRLHVPVSVDDLAQSVWFHSTLFAAAPVVAKADYAKWTLDEPRMSFAIGTRSDTPALAIARRQGAAGSAPVPVETINGGSRACCRHHASLAQP